MRVAHPELAPAVDMQIELIDLHRRIQGRLTTPLGALPPAPEVEQRLRSGRRLVEATELPEGSADFRLIFRQIADLLRRYDMLDPADYDVLQRLGRNGDRLDAEARAYYIRTDRSTSRETSAAPAGDLPAIVEQVFLLALRPFLSRSAEVWATRADLTCWGRGSCPYCGSEPDFGVLGANGDRLLVCARCVSQWPFAARECPFCGNVGPGALTSFASRDGHYRVDGCNQCHKYVKAFDARSGGRPPMPVVDVIATLPLDAAAIQQGYDG